MSPDRAQDRSHDCPILHVDMDAFYASVAIRDRPELHDVPVIVGGGHRGVVLAANYPARRHGVRSALPMTRARRMCPEAVVLPPDYDEVESVSSSVMEIFRQVTPVVEAVSLDEAFLDVSGSWRRLGTSREIAEHVRARVSDEQRVTCSVGVAGSVSVAKLASRRAKPDGVVVVPPREVTAFLHPLDVGELYGVGEKTREQLHRLGLRTVGQVAHTPVATLQRGIGAAAGAHLHHLAWGTDRRTLTPRRPTHEPDRSMGADETFGRDTDDRAVVVRELLRLTAKVTHRMRTAGVAGRTVTIRVRFSDFTTITRSRTLPDATDVTGEVHATAVGLFDALGLQRARIRLVGVRVEGLVPRGSVQRQLVLGARERGWEDADRAVDAAASRFGGGAVRRATLLLGDRP
ncbi:DNA polymerase-4 [Nocardioides scoriae]|uniref:DNA polymerase IV n=1 Tax=Nocardioides scoriae TaxID=642780 RepID=A0A1H1L6H3_9ACTN|nr:DNA polymerase IV [Nocardioides scoriae]SDR70194.1 DNA polymerase-4 [Nocardioides scoriae]